MEKYISPQADCLIRNACFAAWSVENVTVAICVSAAMILLVNLIFCCYTRRGGFYHDRRRKCFGSTDVKLATTTMCLGRRFKLGMLYASSNDSLFPFKNTLWTHWDIKKHTSSHEKPNISFEFDVITDDSISNKLHNLGVESNLALLNLLGGLVKTSRSAADYLQDNRKSNRQVRVVLQCRCVTKYKELKMPDSVKIVSPGLLLDDILATHVVVRVEYGADAYFVFDKDLGDGEDYKETLRLMESLISYLPVFTKENKRLTDKEKAFSKQLRYTLHTDIPIQNPQSFEEAVDIYDRILPGFAAMGIVLPIKAWLYPLHYIGKKVATTAIIEQSYTDLILEAMDRLRFSNLMIHYLLNHEVCSFYNRLYNQLEEVQGIIDQNRLSLYKNLQELIPQVIQMHCKAKQLEDIIMTITDQSISIQNWLYAKEKEMFQISEYLTILKSAGKQLNCHFCKGSF